MKLAIAIAFLFIGLVHSATISTESLDALKTKPAFNTVDTVETVPLTTESKRDAFATIDKKKTLTTEAVNTVDTVDTNAVETLTKTKREPTAAKESFDKQRSTVDTITKNIETVDTIETRPTTEAKAIKRDTLTTITTSNIDKDAKTTESFDRFNLDSTKRSTFDMMSMDIPDGMNASQCIYKPDESLLTCKGPTETVECPTTFVTGTWNNTHRSFIMGIAPVPCKENCTTPSYWMYRRRADNSTTYRNHTVANGTIELQLWSGEAASNVRGLNVTDVTCYTKIVKTITEGCKTPRMVRVTSNWTNTVEEVGLCGEILIFDKTIQKRWLYGYGWGLGAGLWGWGAYPGVGYLWG